MKPNLVGAVGGTIAGFVMAWAGLSDPKVIRDMLLLRELDVFLLMGSAMAVAALGVRVLRRVGARAVVTREPIAWSMERPARRHLLGSLLFGLGWSIAATCPGPAAAMIGEGRPTGLLVALGILAGVLLQGALVRRSAKSNAAPPPFEVPGAVGL
jgi:uncharacterized membrane protein YedE/YeeE